MSASDIHRHYCDMRDQVRGLDRRYPDEAAREVALAVVLVTSPHPSPKVLAACGLRDPATAARAVREIVRRLTEDDHAAWMTGFLAWAQVQAMPEAAPPRMRVSALRELTWNPPVNPAAVFRILRGKS